ncbi:hypothetical protein MPSYJ_44460 [Mycolicibacterium psychrotolerans]|uniref:Uncharacterized protein n=2 Tax=Mycolicibacterium psychrotolerans TaxID=216929 RepID=A0A7I7MFN8_9MYCO|nr:hypothetical protein MPSYJ_44460 [Mycolicibacterium psychrotolerans]
MRAGLDLSGGGTAVALQSVAPLDGLHEVTAETIAKLLTGIGMIGAARNALEEVGLRATIAGNRITINDEYFAQFVGAISRPTGHVEARWVIYSLAGTPPVWVVGAEQ